MEGRRGGDDPLLLSPLLLSAFSLSPPSEVSSRFVFRMRLGWTTALHNQQNPTPEDPTELPAAMD